MRDWEKVFKELSVDFDAKYLRDLNADIADTKRQQGKYVGKTSPEEARPYAPSWMYIDRLDKVLGRIGYRKIVTNLLVQHAENQKHGSFDLLTVDVKLQLFEDDLRTVAFEVQKPGIAELLGASSMQLNLGKAEAAGLKDCCEEFGIGGDIYKIWKKAHAENKTASEPKTSGQMAQRSQQSQRQLETPQQTQPQTRQNQTTQPQKSEIFKVKPNGVMAEGKNGSYYVPVKTTDGKEFTLWFYKNRYEALLQEPSKCTAYGCVNRFDDLRKVWANSKQELTIAAQINMEKGWLYFHNLAGSK